MLLSWNWLNDHVDLSGLEPADVARTLTMRTALIEGFVDQRASLEGVMVGDVVECSPHPSAERLTLCRVATGSGEPVSVVCGAPNVQAGQRVLYAGVGTRLPNGVKLRKARIRGETSLGMICAEDELGLGPEHDGILVLDGDREPGTPAAALPGLADVVFEIDNKSINHRPDLWGHRGFARELAAIYGRELKPLALDLSLAAGDEGPAIELADGCGCPLYAGWCVDLEPGRSPDWLRFRLHACGMRPISSPVDLSNYVMLELGQPTHPFDRDRLAGDRVVVRPAGAGESLRTLDGVERALLPSDLVIADGEHPVALAGIMGSEDAEVGDATTHLFLESASFDARVVRRTSSRLGLRSEALARFEKSLDPALAEEAVRRYAMLVAEHFPGARPAARFRVAGAAAAPERRVGLRLGLVQERLGLKVTAQEVGASLGALGFGLTATGADAWDVAVPSWRATRDVTLPEDLVEEVGRLLGYDRIPAAPPVGCLRIGQRDPTFEVEDALRDGLAQVCAFTEVQAYSVTADEDLARSGYGADAPLPRLTHPRQQAAARLRPSPVPAMLGHLESWLRADPRLRVFEVGRGYGLEADGAVSESRHVVALLARKGPGDSRDLVRELWGVARTVLECLQRGEPRVERWEPGRDAAWCHPQRCARLSLDETIVGHLGVVSPEVLADLDLDAAAGLLCLDVAALAQREARPAAFEAVPRLPPARIDLAFVIDYSLSVEALVACMRKAGPRTLASVSPFDVYRGPPLSDDERSVALHLVFQATDRTLTDEEVAHARERIVAAAARAGARLR